VTPIHPACARACLYLCSLSLLRDRFVVYAACESYSSCLCKSLLISLLTSILQNKSFVYPACDPYPSCLCKSLF